MTKLPYGFLAICLSEQHLILSAVANNLWVTEPCYFSLKISIQVLLGGSQWELIEVGVIVFVAHVRIESNTQSWDSESKKQKDKVDDASVMGNYVALVDAEKLPVISMECLSGNITFLGILHERHVALTMKRITT